MIEFPKSGSQNLEFGTLQISFEDYVDIYGKYSLHLIEIPGFFGNPSLGARRPWHEPPPTSCATHLLHELQS